MSEAFRCDITGVCIADGENRNSYWTLFEDEKFDVLDAKNVRITLNVTVDVFGNNKRAHIGDLAKQEINQIIKDHVATNL